MAFGISADAETYAQGLARLCPNGSRIADLQRKVTEAVAIVDSSQYSLEKELSLEEYRCSVSQIDSYDRDIAKYAAAAHLQASTKTNGDAVEIDPVVASRMNDLAAITSFPDIRQAALKLKSVANEEYRTAYTAIHGEPPNSSSSVDSSSVASQSSENRNAIVGTWRTSLANSDSHTFVYFDNDGVVTNSYDGEKGTWHWVGGSTFSWRFNDSLDQVNFVTISVDGRTLRSPSNVSWSATKL